MKRLVWQVLAALGFAVVPLSAGAALTLAADGYHVYPGDAIQDALQLAATNKALKVVKVHAGEYRPDSKRQAMIWFNKAHNGIRLEAVGPVTLTASNSQLAKPSDPGYPAVVNHVVYFGDALSSNTVLSGFRITGANNFVTKNGTSQFEPARIPKNHFFYSDGGAIKVFGRSYPTIQNIEVVDNFSSPCGAGISVQHQGFKQGSVLIKNCVFRNNRAQGTGSAIDLLAGSSAQIINCLFVGNISNLGEDPVARESGEKPFVNNGVLTIFWKSAAVVRNCTFTGNRNGVDDLGEESAYVNCILADNQLEAGLRGHPRYELAVNDGARVWGCFIKGTAQAARGEISATNNFLSPPPPRFNQDFVPQAPEYQNAGYRPVSR
ncbi:MAG TPA: right-handed parallel beta-helix repeat-containing protein [Candidatus Dormibacteraeota bacterium]|nr:right-handed parallel beta-helix repeat-containing protein [Candidatus Dormibacteraeota bacterium]